MYNLPCNIAEKKWLKSDVALYTTHVQTCLVSNQVVASCLNTDFWLDKIVRDSRPYTGFTSLAAKKVCFRVHFLQHACTDFVAKSRANLYFLQTFCNLQQPGCCKADLTAWVVKRRTRNIAITKHEAAQNLVL